MGLKPKIRSNSLVRTSVEGHPRCGGQANFGAASRVGCNNLVENRFQELAESSSSFEDDDSGPESDDEFVPFDGAGEVFKMRKKQVSDHWREHIQPLMWRCKWLELRIRHLNWLEHKYNKELAKYNHQRGDKVLKRKRRKKIEVKMDIGTYMSEHNLFSYYVKKKIVVGVVPSCEKLGMNSDDEFGPDEDLLCLKSRDGDENLEQVLSKIWALTGHVSKLKSRLDKVMTDLPGNASYPDLSSPLVPCNGLINSTRDPASPPKNRDKMVIGTSHNASQLLPEFNMDDVALPDSSVMGLWEFEDNNLLYDDRFYDGLNGLDDFNHQPDGSPQGAVNENQGTASPSVSREPEMLIDEPAPTIAQFTATSSRRSQRARRPRRF